MSSTQEPQWPDLAEPGKDAGGIREIPVNQYFIDEIVELDNEDATMENIISTFVRLQEELNPDDFLFICYGGYGYFDKEYTNTGS